MFGQAFLEMKKKIKNTGPQISSIGEEKRINLRKVTILKLKFHSQSNNDDAASLMLQGLFKFFGLKSKKGAII